jgi:hypothetical protein
MQRDSNADFVRGFLPALLANSAGVFLVMVRQHRAGDSIAGALLLAELVTTVVLFARGRPMIGWGILAALATVPMLIVGGCFVMITGFH